MDNHEQHLAGLDRLVGMIRDRVRSVVYGFNPGLYVWGRPGASKTHTILDMLDKLERKPVLLRGHVTPIGLFNAIQDHPDGHVVLDDTPSVFASPQSLQMLLAATGAPVRGSKTERLVTHTTASGTDRVLFRGGIYATSNKPLKHGPVLAALRDRISIVNHEPSDEMVIALVYDLVRRGHKGLTIKEGNMVAGYLLEQGQTLFVRPTIRQYVDRAIPDFQQWKAGLSEFHWKDLIRSFLLEQAANQHPVSDLPKRERMAAERRIAMEVWNSYSTLEERLDAWKDRTGKSKNTLYRCWEQLKSSGEWKEEPELEIDEDTPDLRLES